MIAFFSGSAFSLAKKIAITVAISTIASNVTQKALDKLDEISDGKEEK